MIFSSWLITLGDTKTEISDEQFIEAMKKVVKGKEDYIYQKPKNTSSCVYTTKKGKPSCLIGHALKECGGPLPEFDSEQNQLDAYSYLVECTTLSEKVIFSAAAAQEAQDNKYTWSEALNAFYSELDWHNSEE